MYRIYLWNWIQFNIYEICHEIKNDGGYYKHNINVLIIYNVN
jgi:hypothetical protein